MAHLPVRPGRPHQRRLRLCQLRAKRDHQRGQHLIPRTSIITRRTRTLLPPGTAYPAIPHHRGIPLVNGTLAA